MTMTLLNPVQEPVVNEFKQAPRLKTLKGKTLGIYNNKKLNAAKLLEYIAEELARDARFDLYRGEYHPHAVMESNEWVGLEQCDAVILANGDCGACRSSSGIANTIELEKRGIPTLLISTPPFADADRAPWRRWARPQRSRSGRSSITRSAAPPISELRARACSAADQCRAVILDRALRSSRSSQPAFAAE